ncbi:MAG: site-2 protease family protein [Dehalococcoidia bacterium]|nr:site-2 protease family protein [Dehalococcoidia bacterium]
MLFQFFDLDQLTRDPMTFFLNLLFGLVIGGSAILVAITIHEFCHALASNYLGDPTARRLGRVSLNPLVHLDPLGTLFLILAGFGWGKPVPVNGYALRGGLIKGMAMVSASGPLSNLSLAAVLALAVRFGLFNFVETGPYALEVFLKAWVQTLISINLVLAVFNMIPVAPLDGFKVAVGILPRELAIPLARTEQYGMGILLVLVISDQIFRIGILSFVLGPIVNGLFRLFLGSTGAVFLARMSS